MLWSQISTEYQMRYTDKIARVYHTSPNGLMRGRRTLKTKIERSLGLVLWTAYDLNVNIKYFWNFKIYFLKIAFNYVRFRTFINSRTHQKMNIYNHRSSKTPEIVGQMRIRNTFGLFLIFLVYIPAKIYSLIEIKLNHE